MALGRAGVPGVRSGIAAVFFTALLLWTLGPSVRGGAGAPRTIVFYGFSILGEAMNDGIFPAFQARWKERTGEAVELTGAFAGSGTIASQVLLGAPADFALVALELDARRIAEGGRTAAESWRKLPHGGVVVRTPVVILVRPGNPKGIRDFADLARPGIRVVHPDPLTSGGALWAILAEYGAGQRAGPGGGRDLLLGIWRNVVAQASSARGARTQFENGFGDALVTYEQEAVRDRAQRRLPFDVVYPRATVLSEQTLVLLDRNVPAGRRALVDAFAAFLWSEEAQRIFAGYGFRSVDDAVNAGNPAFCAIPEAFGIDAFGGWSRAKREIVDRVWRDDVMRAVRP